MDALYRLKSEDYDKVNEVVKEDLFARQGYVLRDGKSLGVNEGYYLYLTGDKSFLKKAEKLLGDIVEKIKDKEILEKIKTEQESVAEGVGFIFG